MDDRSLDAVRLQAVSVSFGPASILHQVSLAVADGERMVLLGKSGSGKTTLLRVIAGLEKPTRGEVWINGVDGAKLAPSQRGISMVFQDYAVYPQLTVLENLRASLVSSKLPGRELSQRIEETLDWLQIKDLAQRKPAQLSGGQLQRVALAKAIVNRPRILLLDEPFSQVDTPLRDELRDLFVRTHRQFPMSMVVVTHDALDAMRLGNRVAILDHGSIVECGSVNDVYARPQCQVTAELLSPLGLNKIRLGANDLASSLLSDHFHDVARRDTLELWFRPESVRLQDQLEVDPGFRGLRLLGELSEIVSVGFAKLATLRIAQQQIRALVDRNFQPIEPAVVVAVNAADLLTFSSQQ